jgi:hypothetical protein
MNAWVLAITLLVSFVILPTTDAQESIISKPDADMIFAFTRSEWERYVRQVAPPAGWTLRLLPHATGTGLARFQQSTGIGASVQPLYSDVESPPGMLVVGSYYPPGVIRITDEVIRRIEQAAQLDLGPTYQVSVTHAKLPGTDLEAIELVVTREPSEPRGPKAK